MLQERNDNWYEYRSTFVRTKRGVACFPPLFFSSTDFILSAALTVLGTPLYGAVRTTATYPYRSHLFRPLSSQRRGRLNGPES